MKKRVIFWLFCMLIGISSSYGQNHEDKLDISFGADLVSRYVWRGSMVSQSPCIQPEFQVCLGAFYMGAWGSYSFQEEPYQEWDFSIGWSNDFLDLSLADYFCPSTDSEEPYRYFMYEKGKTSHLLDLSLTLNGLDRFPAYITGSVFVYGDDLDENQENRYSSYFEVGYSLKIKEVEVVPFFGLTPREGYYGDGFGVVNTGVNLSRDLKINDQIALPLGLSVMCNPREEQVFMVFSLGIQ